MDRKALTNKLIVVGVDGLDPRLAKKYLDAGEMPNMKALLDKGVAREDLVLLGAVPTITPPMWTTLATGAYPITHGITCFTRQSKKSLDTLEYNLDSAGCLAEQIWNVTAEAGLKTLVLHWPGSSWPPTSDSENLYVVDGTQPAGINFGVAAVDSEKIVVADVKTAEPAFKEKAAADSKVPCVIEDLNTDDSNADIVGKIAAKEFTNVMLSHADGEGALSDAPFDVAISPIKDAQNWAFELPEDAKEFTVLHSAGLVRRPCIILKNEQGVYDRVVMYKSKKNDEPVAVLPYNVFVSDIIDDAIKGDVKYMANRSMRLLELSPDGSHLKLWVSMAMDITNDTLWHPTSLFKTVTDAVGYPQPVSLVGGADQQLITDCMGACWERSGEWQSDAVHYLIENEDFDVIFSHFHNVDLQSHMIAKYLKNGHKDMKGEVYQEMLKNVYLQTDRYIGRYLDLIDQGWTVLVLSDHGLVCPEHEVPLLCDSSGVNVGVMEELGFTAVKHDENGNPLHEIDWENTKAVQIRCNHIWINLKGRNEHGIVDPEEQYELEEEIITALYSYKAKDTGRRIVSLAMRNKDAVLLGMGGPECGDIMIWLAEGYNYDHGESLSTTYGHATTSTSPIFLGAGPGLEEGVYTDRIIRQVDVAPTIAALLGVRMPAQSEGSVVHQILSEVF